MQRTETTTEDQIKIKTLLEYILFDQYQDTATFSRFEQCFQPLFNNISISIERVFKDICGEKKKYINYNRFARAYLQHLNNQSPTPDSKTFFDTLLNKILKPPKSFVGKNIEKTLAFSTVKSCKKREYISLVEVLSDKDGKIHGINLEYDGVFKSRMYPSKIGDDLLVSLEMNLGLVDERPLTDDLLEKFEGIREGNFRDAVTHIFGTYDEEKSLITFLGFKCVSGKTVFVGFPEGDGFLFGNFGSKFHDIKLQMNEDGITKLEPGFKANLRINYYLGEKIGKLKNQDLDKDELIKDEKELQKLNNDVEIDKLITTPIVEDDHFFNKKLKDEISGNDYKEVVNQHPRNWILRLKNANRQTSEKKPMNLMETLKIFNQEQELRAPTKLRARKLRAGGRRPQSNPQMGAHGPKLAKGASGPINNAPMNPMMGPDEPWLHKTKIFKHKPKHGGHGHTMVAPNSRKLKGKKKLAWNGKIEKKTNPSVFLNKHNYLGLKEKLGKLIHDEVAKQTEGNEAMKTVLLNQIIPDPGTNNGRLRGKKNLSLKPKKKLTKLKMKNLKGEVSFFGEEKKAGTKLRAKPAKSVNKTNNQKEEKNVVYSDALQILNDMSDKREEKKNQNNVDNLFGFGKNYGNVNTKKNSNYNPFSVGHNDDYDNFGFQKLRGFNNNNSYNNNYNNYNNNLGPQKMIPANSMPPQTIPASIPAYGNQQNQQQNQFNNYNNMNNNYNNMNNNYNNNFNNYNNNYNNMNNNYNNNFNNYNNMYNNNMNMYNNNYNNYQQGPYGQYNQYGQQNNQFNPQSFNQNQNMNNNMNNNMSNSAYQINNNNNYMNPPQIPPSQQTMPLPQVVKPKEEPKPEPIDPEKYKAAQEKWLKFKEGIEKKSGLYILQTIGSIIKAMRLVSEDDEEKSKIPLAEQVKLYKLLEENEIIVDFLTQSVNDTNTSDDNNAVESIDIGEEEEEDNILIPDEHPEHFTNLEELQSKLDDIKKLLENKKLKEEDKKKIEQLYNLYLQQKNILIENETKAAKKEVISQNQINVNKYIQEEQEKRKKAQEEEQKKMEQKHEEESKTKIQKKTQSILNQKVSTKIYRNQKMPTGDKPWVDDIFPPEKQSLCPYNKKGWVLPPEVLDSDVYGFEDIKWCRVEEILNTKDYTVFVDGSTMDDILQGNLGDCYFLSVLGSLCAFPDFFDKLFHTKEKTKEHVYGIYIYINGKWELVLVDDYFPYQGSRFKQFTFGSSSGNEIWVSLLEKAWAKVNGSYAKISCGGDPNEVFDVLTEAYSEKHAINRSSKDKIWKMCEEGFNKGYVMTAGTSGDTRNLNLEEMGLEPGHAYTFLKTYTVNTKSGVEKIVKLRNPWGNGEFNGAWSDSSKKWTPDTKKQCEYRDEKDDGVFYMSFDDFIKYFVTMGIVKLEHNYQTTMCKIPKAKAIKCQVLKLTVTERTEKCYIQLYQKNPRIILKDGTYQNTVISYMILLDKDFKYLKSISNNNMHLGIETDLQPGVYYVLCDVNYRYVNENGKNRGYKVTCYSKIPILIENVTERIDSTKALEVGMYYYCKNNITPSKHKTGMQVYISKNYNSDLPFLLIGFENSTHNNYKVKLEVKPKGSKSFCLYNDSIATENDTQVIKEVKSGGIKIISIMKYTVSSMFSLSYEVMDLNDERTYETDNPVFDEEGEQIDDDGYLFQYVKEVGNGDGYTVGLENIGEYKIKLRLELEGLIILDNEFKGKNDITFVSEKKSKKVFNLKVDPKADGLSFEFVYA